MKKIFKKCKALSFLVLPLLFGSASTALAQTVNGTGSTFPLLLYQDMITNDPIVGSWSYGPALGGSEHAAFLTGSTVSFSGSETALTSADLATYSQSGTWGPLIQVPAIATSVVLPYKEVGITTLNLTTAEVCRIFSFSPASRTWNQITTAADDGGVGSTNRIQIVYRSEPTDSGATYLLSRFLNAACGPFLPAGKFFTVSNVFKTMVATALPTTLPAQEDQNFDGFPDAWVGVNGDAGMSGAVAGNQMHRLGYISPDPLYTGVTNNHVARIDGLLPTIVGTWLSLPSPPSGAARQSPFNWVPAYSIPINYYPIWGTTNLLFSQCYAGGFGPGTKGAAIKDFLTKLMVVGAYSRTIFDHNFVLMFTPWRTAIKEAFLEGSDGNGLAFGNPADCNGIPGRP
ncbi:substrate-binding domain-containing protein [Variovorax sp.]|jgi:phosphate transport system substrate-binding protein|uniref:substrate-binding domain-containing protein n=1 Tax=Variovorax sp. TaxID=1871043 RepID=UPI000C5D69DF|nr:substrate-binding domain-containing protein [Variovorax sp.]MBS79355.1 hypothetical protein [Variovorax sp.]